jgi:DNA primase
VAGRIRREDVDLVRERAKIDEIVGEHVTLRASGAGSMKGLCPFHDERTPSFHVRPHLGLWHCFGCGEGGDVFSFLQKLDGLGFAQAVEYLAGRYGIELHYEEGGRRSGVDVGTRQRLLAANRSAQEFFAAALNSPEAEAGRRFLTSRGFDSAVAEQFGVGFAPSGWDNLLRHLRGQGFTDAELAAAGLVSQGRRGVYDRFRGRLTWPIRDLVGEVLGFGARKLFDDDPGPKYLNTPETTLYRKSQVLYGLDLARREIAKTKQVVVVEGYTDVMAAHLSGVPTAVATCGTAFGADHTRVVRRLLGDTSSVGGLQLAGGVSAGGEVIFTFDGDAAGQQAALRAFGEDQQFLAQTFVAIEPSGMDPCDLRLAKGPDAVRALVASRVPLFEFVIKAALATYDLDTAEGRVAALRAAAPVVAGIRDQALRPEYARLLAGWLGLDIGTVRDAVRTAKAGVTADAPDREPEPTAEGAVSVPGLAALESTDPAVRIERLAAQALLTLPNLIPMPLRDMLTADTFAVPAFRAVQEAVAAAGWPSGPPTAAWLNSVCDAAPGELAEFVTRLAVLPIAEDREEALSDYAAGVVTAAIDRDLVRQIGAARGRLQRADPNEDGYRALFEEVVTLEAKRRALRS